MQEHVVAYPRRRDRRGRGPRGPLLPPQVPIHRSRAELFDDLVLDVLEHLNPAYAAAVDGIEFAVEDVPTVTHSSPDEVVHLPNVVEDATVPLSRLIPAHIDGADRAHPPRIIVYRRPLEVRGRTAGDLAMLVREVVVEQLASLLGLDVAQLDPELGDD